MKELETEDLLMRQFKESDLDDLFEVTSNKKVAEASDFNVHETRQDTLIEIETAIQDYNTYDACWAIEYKPTHKVIGYIRMLNVSLKNKQCTLSWGLNQNAWGLGYSKKILRTLIKYLFEEHPFEVIIVRYYNDCHFENHILEDAGMKRDAILRYRRINFLSGNKESLIIYSILKTEMNW